MQKKKVFNVIHEDMIANYYQYNRIDPVLEAFINRVNELNYRYYASELLNRIIKSSDFNLDLAIRKAIAICKITGLPSQEHFTCIYRSDSFGLQKDWKLSELACSIIIISYESSSDKINEIQNALLDYYGF
jgi:hypothetical protein